MEALTEAVIMEFLRRTWKIFRTQHLRNETIREQANIEESIIQRTEERQLMWYAHVRLVENERWQIRVLSALRTRATWLQGVQFVMRNRRLQEED